MPQFAMPGPARARSRRFLLLGLGLAAAIALLLTVFNPFVSATSGGDPYAVPPVIDTNPAPNIVERLSLIHI